MWWFLRIEPAPVLLGLLQRPPVVDPVSGGSGDGVSANADIICGCPLTGLTSLLNCVCVLFSFLLPLR